MGRKLSIEADESYLLKPDSDFEPSYNSIHSVGQVLNHTFYITRTHSKAFWLPFGLIASVFTLLVLVLKREVFRDPALKFDIKILGDFVSFIQRFFEYIKSPFVYYFDLAGDSLILVIPLFFMILMSSTVAIRLLNIEIKENQSLAKSISYAILPTLIIIVPFLLASSFGWLLLVVLFPVFSFWYVGHSHDTKNTFSAFATSWQLTFTSFGLVLSLFALISLIIIVLNFSVNSVLVYGFILPTINTVVLLSEDQIEPVFKIIMTLFNAFSFSALWGLSLLAFGVLAQTLVEIKTSKNLIEQINHIGENKKFRGLNTEKT